MAVYDYAEKFNSLIQEKYNQEMTSQFLVHTNPQVKFINAQTIKVPEVSIGGFGDHDRNTLGFNSSNMSNTWTPYKLEFDRDAEWVIDPMDVDETNLVLDLGARQVQIEEEVTIPEKDSYRYSKLYKEAVEKGATVEAVALTTANILAKFDELMEKMDNNAVKAKRYLVATPHTVTLLKQAEGIQRTLEASGKANIDRRVYSLDDVEIIKVVPNRLKTDYEDAVDENNQKHYVPTAESKQIQMMLIEPTSIICEDKYAYMKLFTPGSDSRTADNYVYQNRYYTDLFLIKTKAAGVAIITE